MPSDILWRIFQNLNWWHFWFLQDEKQILLWGQILPKNTNNFLVNFLTNFWLQNYWIFAGCFFTPLTPKNESIFVPFPTKTSRKSNRVISKAEKMLWSAGGEPGRQKNGKNWAARTVMRKTRTLACAFVLLALSSSVCSWVRTLNPWRPRYHAFFDRLKRKCVE